MKKYAITFIISSILISITVSFSYITVKGGNQHEVGENIPISWTDEDVLRLTITSVGDYITRVTTPTNPYIFTTKGLEEGIYIVTLLNPYDIVVAEEVVVLGGDFETTQLIDIYPSPNPLDLSSGSGTVEFVNVPEGASVKIYDFGGFLVYAFMAGSSAEWDGYNEDGSLVSSGPYIFYIENDGEVYIGKFAIVK